MFFRSCFGCFICELWPTETEIIFVGFPIFKMQPKPKIESVSSFFRSFFPLVPCAANAYVCMETLLRMCGLECGQSVDYPYVAYIPNPNRPKPLDIFHKTKKNVKSTEPFSHFRFRSTTQGSSHDIYTNISTPILPKC